MTFTKSLKGSRVSGVLVVAIILTGLVLLLSNPHRFFAQEVGATLFGTVTDAAGASVPDANVTVTDPTTGKTVTATTQNNGGYVVTGANTWNLYSHNRKDRIQKIGPDRYRVGGLSESPPGLATRGRRNQHHRGSGRQRSPGRIWTASVGGVVDTRQVQELPLNIRRFGSLALLVPRNCAGSRRVFFEHLRFALQRDHLRVPMGQEAPAITY